AAGIEKAPQLGAGVMEAPGGGPAIRAAEDRAGAVLASHARKLVGGKRQRLLPAHFDERLGAAPFAAGRLALLEPALAHRGPGDAHRRIHHLRDRAEHRRRIAVALEGLAAHQAPVLDYRGIRAPMRELL